MHCRPQVLRVFAGICSLASVAAVAQQPADSDRHHDIEEIIVTAMPIERAVEQLAQPTSVLEGNSLVTRQSTSIGETVANEPGVHSTYFGPVAARPVIRGQYGERVRVLSNGLDALDASALSEDHAVSLDSILAERVEIVRGPATLLYGSGAAGGLVNIVDSRIHEQRPEDPFGGAASLGTDSATGKESGAVKFDVGKGSASAHLDYFRRRTGELEIPGYAESGLLRAEEHDDDGEEEAFGTVANTDSDVEGGAAAITLHGDGGYVGLSVSRYGSNYGVPVTHAHVEEEHEEGAADEEPIKIDLDQTRYDLRGAFGMSGIFERLKFHVAGNQYEHTELEGGETGTVFDSDGVDARIELRHTPVGELDGAVGLQYKKLDFAAIGDEAFVPPSDTTQLSLFLFEDWAVNRDWVLQTSARAERQQIDTPQLPDYDDTAFGASFGAIWSFTDDMSLAANLALTERHPNSTELYADGPHLAVQRFETGSVAGALGMLDKEFSTNVDVTLRGNLPRLEWSVTGFLNDVDDYILLAPTGDVEDGLPVFRYVQADAELYGVEAEALFDLLDRGDTHVHARFFGDFVHGEQVASGDYLPRLPPLRYGVSLHYARGPLEGAVEAVSYQDQDKVAPAELPTDGFTLVSVELSWRFARPDLLLFVRATNLGDEDARRHTSPLKDYVPLPGRSLALGLRVDF